MSLSSSSLVSQNGFYWSKQVSTLYMDPLQRCNLCVSYSLDIRHNRSNLRKAQNQGSSILSRLVSGQRTPTFESSFHLIVSLPHGRQVTSQPGNQDGRDQGERNLPEMQDAELQKVVDIPCKGYIIMVNTSCMIYDIYQIKDKYQVRICT